MWTFDIKVGFCNCANKTHFHKVFCSWSRFESEALYNSFFRHVTPCVESHALCIYL